MSAFVLVTSLLAISSVVSSAQIPCTDEKCTNLNIFLGPKWGSKTLRIPNNLGVDDAVKDATERPPAPEKLDDKAVKPTDWAAESKDVVSEKEWVAELDEEADDSDWDDDASGALNSVPPQPTEVPLEKIAELNRKIIDWATDSSIKLSDNAMEPTIKPTDWIARTERTDSKPPQTKEAVELQEVTKLYDERTPNSRFIIPDRRPTPEDDSFELDYSNDYQNDFRFDNAGSTKILPKTWTSVNNLNALFDNGALNLTGFGFPGGQVKQILSELSVDTRTQLHHLSLSHNQVRSLPAFTFPVELEYGLVELHLDNNPLSVLDSYTRFELSRLGNLKVLSLARTGLQFFESLYIPSLVSLDLSGNLLSTLPVGLDGFRALQQLDLSSNRISLLSGPPPTTFENLRALNLSHNGLQYIWYRPFERMVFLDVLDLSNNRLKYTTQIEDIPPSMTLYLAGNPWECSCPLVRFLHDPLSWPYVADKKELLCTDQNIRVPWPVTSLRPQDVTIGCPRRWDWLRLPAQRVERWFDSHGWHMSSLLSVLWWALLVVGLVMIWRSVRRYQNTTAPYSILDEKQTI